MDTAAGPEIVEARQKAVLAAIATFRYTQPGEAEAAVAAQWSTGYFTSYNSIVSSGNAPGVALVFDFYPDTGSPRVRKQLVERLLRESLRSQGYKDFEVTAYHRAYERAVSNGVAKIVFDSVFDAQSFVSMSHSGDFQWLCALVGTPVVLLHPGRLGVGKSEESSCTAVVSGPSLESLTAGQVNLLLMMVARAAWKESSVAVDGERDSKAAFAKALQFCPLRTQKVVNSCDAFITLLNPVARGLVLYTAMRAGGSEPCTVRLGALTVRLRFAESKQVVPSRFQGVLPPGLLLRFLSVQRGIDPVGIAQSELAYPNNRETAELSRQIGVALGDQGAVLQVQVKQEGLARFEGVLYTSYSAVVCLSTAALLQLCVQTGIVVEQEVYLKLRPASQVALDAPDGAGASRAANSNNPPQSRRAKRGLKRGFLG